MTTTDINWLIERIVVGPLMVNAYLIAWKPTRDAIVVDPGDESEIILDRIKSLELNVNAIINTHGHGDHIGGNREMKEALDVPIIIGRHDAGMLTDPWMNMSAPFSMSTDSPPADKLLDEGDIIEIGEGRLNVLHAPGHSPGSIVLAGNGFAVVGDVLFAGSIGRTDFPGGSLEMLLKMIREKILPLGDRCHILPGHGPETTVGQEKRHNPFLQPGFMIEW